MITQEQLDADRAAVEAAQAKLAQDQAEFDHAQPYLSLLSEIESYISQIAPEAQEAFRALVEKARTLL